MKEYTFTFNGMLFDTVCHVIENYEKKKDHLSAEDMHTLLEFIKGKMSVAQSKGVAL